jgi:flavin reductase (DIM6/NTAB) family NADH-FMN oxidoreductase RutF
MESQGDKQIITLDTDFPIWDRFFTVAPLVLIGSRDANSNYNFAPKHMAFPMSWENFFGFICTPKHATYQNIKRENVFTVTYPRPTQVVSTSLAAASRTEDDVKPALSALDSFLAEKVDGRFVSDGYLFLECELKSVFDDFGPNSLITGRVVIAHVHQEALRTSDRDDNDLIHDSPLLVYVDPGRFARIEQSFAFPFPSDYKR